MFRLDAHTLRSIYGRKQVLLTGHTGFKGGWLALWLASLEARVTGFALTPNTDPSLFEDAGVGETCRHVIGDVRDPSAVRRAVRETKPDIVFHLAAQPIVRVSYEQPIETLETNVMGTAHLLEAIRLERHPCAIVVVTSDKCYENREWPFGYRENEPMGGHDLYSSSKGAAEIVVQSYRRSFFPPDRLASHGVAIATARAGNVIGGGDWARDRIIPDAIRALSSGVPIPVRNPGAVRPWQHVLEPLGGYMLLGARLLEGPASDRARFCEAWNFGPDLSSTQPVSVIATAIAEAWGEGSWTDVSQPGAPHEAGILRLSTEKAFVSLGWSPRWSLPTAVERTVAWYRARHGGARGAALRDLMLGQVGAYLAIADGGAL